MHVTFSCSAVRPAHFVISVARWKSIHCSRAVRSSLTLSGSERSTAGAIHLLVMGATLRQ